MNCDRTKSRNITFIANRTQAQVSNKTNNYPLRLNVNTLLSYAFLLETRYVETEDYQIICCVTTRVLNGLENKQLAHMPEKDKILSKRVASYVEQLA